MAIIDYHAIRSGKYAQLTPSAKALIPVLSCLCDDYTGEIPDEYSAADTLAQYAGLSPKSVRAALQELAEDAHQVVALDTKNGRIPSVQYRPAVRLGKNARMAAEQKGEQQERQREQVQQIIAAANEPDPDLGNDYPGLEQTDDLGNGYRGDFPEKTPRTPTTTDENQNGKSLALNDCFKDLKTTTSLSSPLPPGGSAADKVKGDIIRMMERRHNPELIKQVLDAMKYLNGEVKKPSAFFIWCIQNETIPGHQVIKERKKAEEATRRVQEREEKSRREWNKMAERVRKEQDDPEAQARIKSIQEQFLNSC